MFTKTAFLSQAMRKCLIKQHFKVKLWLLSIKDPKQVLIFSLIHYYKSIYPQESDTFWRAKDEKAVLWVTIILE